MRNAIRSFCTRFYGALEVGLGSLEFLFKSKRAGALQPVALFYAFNDLGFKSILFLINCLNVIII